MVNFELIHSSSLLDAATNIKHFRYKRSTKISSHKPTAIISPQLCIPSCIYRLRRHDGKELIVNLTSVTDWQLSDTEENDNDTLATPLVQYMDDSNSITLKNWTYSHCLFRAVVVQPSSDDGRWSFVNLCDGMVSTVYYVCCSNCIDMLQHLLLLFIHGQGLDLALNRRKLSFIVCGVILMRR